MENPMLGPKALSPLLRGIQASAFIVINHLVGEVPMPPMAGE
jgi:hypothetical protein